MPYASEEQRRFMHARHPGIAARWDDEERDHPLRRALGRRKRSKGYPVVEKSLVEIAKESRTAQQLREESGVTPGRVAALGGGFVAGGLAGKYAGGLTGAAAASALRAARKRPRLTVGNATSAERDAIGALVGTTGLLGGIAGGLKADEAVLRRNRRKKLEER